MKKIFDNYVNNAFGGTTGQAEFKLRQFVINYRKFFPHSKESKVLDIGIGLGEMLSCMKSWGYVNYHGIDISQSTVEHCLKLGLSCELTENTEQWLSNHKNEFSVITLLDVIEHIPKEKVIVFLETIYDALKPGGIVIVQTPNMQAVDSQLHRYNDITHMLGFTEHSLNQILMESGYSFIEFYGFEWITGNKIKHIIAKRLRNIYNNYIYMRRRLSGNLNPDILHPVFFAVAKKT